MSIGVGTESLSARAIKFGDVCIGKAVSVKAGRIRAGMSSPVEAGKTMRNSHPVARWLERRRRRLE